MNVKGDIFARLFSAGCILAVFIGLVGVPPGSSLAMPTGIIIRVDAHATGSYENGTSWPNAYRSLQLGLSVAAAGDEIWVAEGLYKPDTPTGRGSTFSLIAGVGIYGGFGGQDVGETLREQRDWRQYTTVLSGVGATKPSRDSVDTRVINSVTNRNGSIIDSQDDVGGWPTLSAGSAPTDTDGDGMPDSWESSYGTNPSVADNNGDLDSDGYTNLEEYINSL